MKFVKYVMLVAGLGIVLAACLPDPAPPDPVVYTPAPVTAPPTTTTTAPPAPVTGSAVYRVEGSGTASVAYMKPSPSANWTYWSQVVLPFTLTVTGYQHGDRVAIQAAGSGVTGCGITVDGVSVGQSDPFTGMGPGFECWADWYG